MCASSKLKKPALHKVVAIGHRVRHACELYVWAQYKRDRPRIQCSDPESLGCLCGIASTFFHRVLKTHGIETQIVVGHYKDDGHAWVEWKKKNLDLTLTQFESRAEPLHVTGPGETCHAQYNPHMKGDNPRSLFHHWGPEQYPRKETLQGLQRIYDKLPAFGFGQCPHCAEVFRIGREQPIPTHKIRKEGRRSKKRTTCPGSQQQPADSAFAPL